MKSITFRRAGLAVLLSVSVVGLTAVAAAPSVADTSALPANDAMYALPCTSSTPYVVLAAVDPTLSEVQAIGNGEGAEDCATNAAWDAADSTGYFESSILAPDTGDAIYSVNVSNGDIAEAFQPHTSAAPIQLSSFTVGADGQGYAVAGSTVYRMSMQDGTLTPLGDTNLGDTSLVSLAVDPVTSVLYAVDEQNDLYSIDLSTGVAVSVASLQPDISEHVTQIEFDSSGTLWTLDLQISDQNVGTTSLYYDTSNSGNFASPVAASQTPLLDGNDAILSEAGFVALGARITSASSATTYAGKAFSFDVAASGSGPVFSISQGQLPAGITLDPATGVISGTTTQVGTYSLTLTATEGTTVLTQTFTLTVLPQLALTGVDPSQGMLVAVSLLGLGAMFAGAALVRRRLRAALS